jgi:hypothetical protein
LREGGLQAILLYARAEFVADIERRRVTFTASADQHSRDKQRDDPEL